MNLETRTADDGPEATLMRQTLEEIADTAQNPTAPLLANATRMVRRRRYRNAGIAAAAVAAVIAPAQLAMDALSDAGRQPAVVVAGPITDPSMSPSTAAAGGKCPAGYVPAESDSFFELDGSVPGGASTPEQAVREQAASGVAGGPVGGRSVDFVRRTATKESEEWDAVVDGSRIATYTAVQPPAGGWLVGRVDTRCGLR